jgi:hypothetical protein
MRPLDRIKSSLELIKVRVLEKCLLGREKRPKWRPNEGGSATGKYQLDVNSPKETLDMVERAHTLAAGNDRQEVEMVF